MHGGSVAVHSPGAGHGTEFVIRLPEAVPPQAWVAPTAHETAPAESPAVAERDTVSNRDGKTPNRRMLLVDDNQDALMSLASLLSLDGHDIRTATDGFQALESGLSFLPEVAVLDIGMPGMDGYELARRIRAQPWGKHMVLVALTGWGQEGDRRRSREAGFDSHWVKPLDIELFTRYLGCFADPAKLRAERSQPASPPASRRAAASDNAARSGLP